MKTIGHILFSFLFMFSALPLLAYTVTGRVIDGGDKSGLVGATVTLRTDSATVARQTRTDAEGRFEIEAVTQAPSQDVEITCLGFKPWSTQIIGNVKNLNLGTIALESSGVTLGEVTVTGSRVIEKPSHFLVMPSAQEIERAKGSMSLLGELKLKMPGLQVNEIEEQVTVDGGTPVLMINGREQPLAKILSMNVRDILRIEYRNTPDIRYADRGSTGIINFITRPGSGGYVSAQVNAGITTARLNSWTFASMNYKKSEWTIGYNEVWRDSYKEYKNSTESYIGGREAIERQSIGRPSKTRDFDNNLRAEYTYMHDANTMLAASASQRWHDNDGSVDSWVKETRGDKVTEYGRENGRNTKRHNTSGDIYFKKNFGNNVIEATATGAYSSGDYDRGMDYSIEFNQNNKTRNKAWMAGGELMYSHQFKRLLTKIGVSYSHDWAENSYRENGIDVSKYRLKKDNVYIYGNIAGNLSKVGYTVGVGAKYFNAGDNSLSSDYWRARAVVTLNYRLSRQWSINYLFMADPRLPQLTDISDQQQTIDDISLQQGNSSLKPSVWTRNRITFRYNTGNFYATTNVSYSRTHSPIISQYSYLADRNMFLCKVENGDFDKRVITELLLSYQNLWGHISIDGSVGWDWYQMKGDGYDHKDSHVYSNLSVNAYWGHWTVFASYEIAPQYTVYGQRVSRSVRYNYVGTRFKIPHWSFELSITNPFTRRGFFYTDQDYSPVRPSKIETQLRDQANMVAVTVKYDLSFGKSFKKANRTLERGRLDTGVNNNY